ncbi:hypothetical protein VNI00_015766 [Paramarasmius palmivorus]|uniref:Protein-S-isoprenylcysteine O-methyltransferase n=1 Tax=Paramarasmius palmivorus TaxID=297713 RepID=A0AAW0BH77_9AGAR
MPSSPSEYLLVRVVKALLVVLCGVSFGKSLTPPNGDPVPSSRPPVGKGLPALREWFLVNLIARAYPIERMIYYIATVNEALFVLRAAIPAIAKLFPHLNFPGHTTTTRFTPQFVSAVLLSILGGIFRVACYRALGREFTYECVPVGQRADNPEIRKNPKLVTHGPYSIVRHPSYVACCMSVIGSALVHLTKGSWIIESGFSNTLMGKILLGSWIGTFGVTLIILILRVGPEDEVVRTQFGEQWKEWSKTVKYKLIPWVY